MATKGATKAAAISNAEAATSSVRPYAPSWLHQLLGALGRLPGSPVLWFALLGVVAGLIYHVISWTIGRISPGQIDSSAGFWGFLLFAELWTAAHLERVASAAVDATRPALRLEAAAFDRLRYELAIAPARPAAIALVVAGVVTTLQYVIDPEGSSIAGLSVPLVATAFLAQLFIVGIFFVLLLQLVRQGRLIRTTLDRSAIVDPFLPGPLSGFSRLTSQVGIIIVGLVTAATFVTPIPDVGIAFVVSALPYVVIPPAIALLTFVVPLYGLHTRLETEKDRLQGEAEHRLKAVLAELNRDVDARDLTRADGLNKQLGSLLQQRDVLAKLPTWPWSTNTFRAVITAILLPITLFIIQGVLSRVLFV